MVSNEFYRLKVLVFLGTVLFLFNPTSALGQLEGYDRRRREVKDSLIAALPKVTDYHREVQMLYNIIDISSDYGGLSSNHDYCYACQRLFDLAVAHGDDHLELDAMTYLCSACPDSIDSYIRIASSLPPTNDRKGTVAFLKYTNTINIFVYKSDSAANSVLVNMISEYRNSDGEDIFKRLELLSGLCAIMNYVTTDNLYIEYLKQLGDLIESLPEDGKSYFPNAYYVLMANAYSRKGMYRESYEADRKLLKFLDELESRHKSEGRIYNSMETYRYVSYRRMLLCVDVISRKTFDSIYHALEICSRKMPAINSDFNSPTSLVKLRYLMGCKRYAEAVPILDAALSKAPHVFWYNEALNDRIIAGEALNKDDPELSEYAVLYINYLKKQQAADISNKTKELQIIYDVNNLERQVSDLQIAKDKATIRQGRIIIFIGLAALLILVALLLYVFHSREMLADSNKKLEEQRKKADLANRMKTMFVENMNHEIRTPLNAVVGFSEIIVNDNGTMPDDERDTYFNLIRENSDMLLTMVSDLLDISEMEAGEMKFKLSQCSLNEICASAAATYKSRVSNKVRLTFTPHEDDLVITSDKQRISQVIRNYISNAVKNTERGSIVVDYSDAPQARTVTLSVTDTGCGVPPDKAEDIFKRFEKLDNFKEGAGIGLNICKMIADGLHAQAKLDTSYTGGARFLFILPY